MGNSKSKRQEEMRREMEEKKRQEEERKKQEEAEKKRQAVWEKEAKPLSILVTSAARGLIARKQYQQMKALAARRQNIAKEILQTEKSYVEGLNIAIDYFYVPLQKAVENRTREFKKRAKTQNLMQIESYYKESGGSRIKSGSMSSLSSIDEASIVVPHIPDIKIEDVKAIFSQIEVIYRIHQDFMQQIEGRVSAWTWTSELGDLFIHMMDWLKTYIQYVNNYNSSLEKIAQMKSVPEFSEWLEKVQLLPQVKAQTIDSFLIMPIQRIPRYVLLLEDILKNTPEGHIDNENISKALDRMKEVASTINEKKAEAESFAILVDLYGRLEPHFEDLCQPHRKFLKEGTLKEEGKPYLFFLFNDILLKVKEKGGRKLKLLMVIMLITAEVTNVRDDKANKQKNTFSIKTTRKTIFVSAKTPEEKNEWMHLINDCIEAQKQKSKSFQEYKKGESS